MARLMLGFERMAFTARSTTRAVCFQPSAFVIRHFASDSAGPGAAGPTPAGSTTSGDRAIALKRALSDLTPLQKADLLREVSCLESRRLLAIQWAVVELKNEFKKADIDADGNLSLAEFETWGMEICRSQQAPGAQSAEPTPDQLSKVFIRQLPPFVGFGICDNSLMVLTGDAIDASFGLWFGVSTMGAAALGNAFSNGCGMMMHGFIERTANSLGLPDPKLSLTQLKHAKTRNAKTAGGFVGVIVGCLLGMWPLLLKSASGDGKQSGDRKEVGAE